MKNFIYVINIVLRLTNIFSKSSVSRANLYPVPIHFNFESNLNLTLLVIRHSYSKAILHVSDSLFEVFS